MTPSLQAKISEYVKEYIKDPGNVIELGSLEENGGVRYLFENARDYVGLDMVRGPGVDVVANLHEVHRLFEYEPDTILCLNTLEHDNMPWLSVKSMKELLIPGGFLVISTVMAGTPHHPREKDYMRFLKDSYTDWFFDGFDVVDLCEVQDYGYGTICGIARKPYRIKHDIKTNKGRDPGYCW